jgi:hypothetical protein
LADTLTNLHASRVVALATEHHLPAIYLFRQFAIKLFGLLDRVSIGARPAKVRVHDAHLDVRRAARGPYRGSAQE